jgi:nucleoside-diphosphate-sugar epimerase
MMKLLITGGNGFVAHNLIKALLNKTEFDINVSSRKLKNFNKDRITIFENMHLSQSTIWKDLLIDVDCVIHCAAQVHRSRFVMFFWPDSYRNINLLATISLLKQAENMNVKHFIYVSSITASKEDSTSNPYSISKYETEQEIIKFCKKSKIQYTILRPPLLYGINSPGNFSKLLWLIKYIKIIPYPSRQNIIPILFISNFISLIELCLCNKNAYGKTFEVCDKDKFTFKDLVVLISEIFNLNVFLVKIPNKYLRFLNIFGSISIFDKELLIDNTELEYKLGWKHPYSTMEALKSMSANISLHDRSNA